MEKKKKMLAGILAASCLLCGCSIGGRQVVLTSGLGSQEVFKIGGEACRLAEAKVYLANYQNIYGKAMALICGNKDFRRKN